MKTPRTTLSALLCAAILLPAMASAQTQSGNNQTGSSTGGATASSALPPGHPPVVTFIMIPLASPMQQQMRQDGCWVKLYGNKNYTGDSLTMTGPVDMPNMVGPFGIDWKGKIRSLETGPKTTLRVYDNENYRDLVSTFNPNNRTPDVSKRLGFFDQMSSLQMSCK